MDIKIRVSFSPNEWDRVLNETSPKLRVPRNGLDLLSIHFSIDLRRLIKEDQNVETALFGANHWLDIDKTLAELADRSLPQNQRQITTLLINMRQTGALKWLEDYSLIWIDANRSAQFGNYSLNSGRDEAKALTRYYIEQQPGELIKLIDALALPTRQREFRRFLDYIRIVIPDIEDVRLRPDTLGRNVYVRRRGREQPLYRSGSGITNVLYLCGRILEASREINEHGALVVIDEPETGLHADFHRRLMNLAKTVHETFGAQWLFSTHSPYLLIDSLTEVDRLILTQIDQDRTSVQSVAIDEDTNAVFESVGFYLPSILNASGVIFVEGSSEVAFLQPVLPKIGIDTTRHRLVIVPLGGDQLAYIDPGQLARIHPRSFVWLDNDLKEGSCASTDGRPHRVVACLRSLGLPKHWEGV